MSLVRSVKCCVLSHHSVLFWICIVCAVVSIGILVVLGIFIHEEYKVTGNFFESTCHVHNITEVGYRYCNSTRIQDSRSGGFVCYRIVVVRRNEQKSDRGKRASGVLFESVNQLENNPKCSYDDCAPESTSVDTYIRRYRNKLRENSFFMCYYLNSNPEILIPNKQFTTIKIIHCLLWPSFSALGFIISAFLLFFDPCNLGIKAGKNRTNLRRTSPMVLSKGRRKRKKAKAAESRSTETSGILKSTLRNGDQRKRRKNKKRYTSIVIDESMLIQIDGPPQDKGNKEAEIHVSKSPKGSEQSDKPTTPGNGRQVPTFPSRRSSGDGSSGSERRQRPNKSPDTQGLDNKAESNSENNRVRRKLKRTISEPTRTHSFLMETNL